MKYKMVIGIEIHVQVKTKSKMFCACPNEFGADPNTNICPVCMGYPGVLPVVNANVIEKAVVAGMMCNCSIQKFNKFDRKNYFYPDQTKNYQISQFDLPICLGGYLDVEGTGFSGNPLPPKRIGITRIHMEEDPAKLTHFNDSTGV
ncbi:MAG: Asp-tRNA(Asn)/Glu-tRNA(Gln) amidotransferase GatCAB subunit B, partial [Verrucomicrobiota bacterium]|nr:Asp-tRNA(Asn)/Glu-tRNA(Gln) amidotransferase GatCAB subunit B [Verrucomicrobiota bacterium]